MNHKPLLALLPVLLLAGCCACGPVCDKPYIRVANDCCLDKDDNRVCDRDEVTTTSRTTTSSSTSTTSTTLPVVDNSYTGRGELVSLGLSSQTVRPGETVTIKGAFKNFGSADVPSVLRCNVVSSSDQTISLSYSEERGVGSGEEEQLIAHYTPSKPGRYVIKCKVYYLNKISSEQWAHLEVAAG